MRVNPITIRPKINAQNFLRMRSSNITFQCDGFKASSQQFPLTQKYGLNLSDIQIRSISPVKITDAQKAMFVEKILEAHELAKKNVDTGNITGRGFATNLCLSDGTWHVATNFNNTRNEISAICGERSAVIVAYNDFLKKLIESGENRKTQNDFKVTYLAMSSAKDVGTEKAASNPCTDCLSWYNTTRFFDDDTRIVYLTKDADSGKYFLEFKTLKEMLPMRGVNSVNSIKTSSSYSFVISDDAKRIMEDKGITNEDIQNTLMKAKETCEQPTNFTPFSRQKIGVAIKTKDRYFCAPKIDWSKRWFVEPLEFAVAKSLDETGIMKAPDIIAYYTDDTTINKETVEQDGIISIKSLGRIKVLDQNAEPLIVVANENGEIDVHSINDYLPKENTFKQIYLAQNPQVVYT